MTAYGWLRLRLAAVAASAVAFSLAVIVLAAITPGYSQWSDAVSRLGSPGERFALAARLVFVTYGLLIAAGASTLRQYAGRQGRWLTWVLVGYAAGCVVAGVAPKDQPGAPPTVISEVHVVAAILAGGLAIGAMALVFGSGPTKTVRRLAACWRCSPGWPPVIFERTWGTPDYGVAERVLLGLGMSWISALAIAALWKHDPTSGNSGPADDRDGAGRAPVGRQPVGADRERVSLAPAELAGPAAGR